MICSRQDCEASSARADHGRAGLCRVHYRDSQAETYPGCAHGGCMSRSRHNGYCTKHYQRIKKYGSADDTALQKPRRADVDQDGLYRCARCRQMFTEEHFYADSRRGVHQYCKPCAREAVRRSAYRLTEEDYRALQSIGTCEVCGSDQSLIIDHDHACCPTKAKSCGRCVRGLLCHRCNQMLGYANDDAALLANAIAYLTREKNFSERRSLA